MSLEVTERLSRFGGPRKQSSEHCLRNLSDRECMTLSIERVDDFVEAHEITDEWQILAIACLIRVSECAGHDVAQFANVAHVNATHIWIKRESPAHGSVCLFLRRKSAHKVLVVERRD